MGTSQMAAGPCLYPLPFSTLSTGLTMGTLPLPPPPAWSRSFQYPIHGSDHGNHLSPPRSYPATPIFQYPIHGSDHGNRPDFSGTPYPLIFQYPIHGSDHGNSPRRRRKGHRELTFSTLSTGLTMGTADQSADQHWLLGAFSTLSTGLTMGTGRGGGGRRQHRDLSVPYPRV